MRNKIIALLACIFLIFTILPLSVQADNSNEKK